MIILIIPYYTYFDLLDKLMLALNDKPSEVHSLSNLYLLYSSLSLIYVICYGQQVDCFRYGVASNLLAVLVLGFSSYYTLMKLENILKKIDFDYVHSNSVTVL